MEGTHAGAAAVMSPSLSNISSSGGFLRGIFYPIMVSLIASFWLCTRTVLLCLFRFFASQVSRIQPKRSSTLIPLEESWPLKPITEDDDDESEELDYGGHRQEEDTSGFVFKFSFQIPEQSMGSKEIKEEEPVTSNNMVSPLTTTTTNISNYRFLSEKDFGGFIVEPEAGTFHVQESYVESNEKLDRELRERLLSVKGLQQFECEKSEKSETECSSQEEELLVADTKKSLSIERDVFEGFDFDSESLSSSDGYSVKELIVDSDGFLSERDLCVSQHEELLLSTNNQKHEDYDFESLRDEVNEELQLSEDQKQEEYHLESLGNSDTESLELESMMNGLDSCELLTPKGSRNHGIPQCELDKFLEEGKKLQQVLDDVNLIMSRPSLADALLDHASEENDELEYELEYLEEEEAVEQTETRKSEDGQSPSSSNLDDEFINLESDRVSLVLNRNSNVSYSDRAVSEKGLHETEEHIKTPRKLQTSDGPGRSEDFQDKEHKAGDSHDRKIQEKEELHDSEEKNQTEPTGSSEEEDSDGLESLWEHQDLIEQLKSDIKRMKMIGLPTIHEEAGSPKEMENPKLSKFDAKFLHEDPMDELNKFCKSYRERMRKFDILNYQKMYAIRFLHLKDPLQSMVSQKMTLTSLFSQSFLPCRRKKPDDERSEKLIKELQTDLETVYVGQACLSWEILWWQYEKFQEILKSDPYGSRRYNQVRGEFQQFQVMLQRFLEDEPFEGARVPYYVKNRWVVGNLLQVPVIKEDCLKNRMEEMDIGRDGGIKIEALQEIMEKSIKIFWQFVKADKDETSLIVKGLIGPQGELQDPADSELMAEIRTNLQKKEKKLKDMLRVGNCLVKKFTKPEEYRSSQEIFFSQVDMKLISRVLKMSRITTDQLVWCHKKLDKISFVDRKLQREPTFLLFPC